MKRTLTLKRESLAELTESDLGGVAAGQYTVYGLSCPIGICFRTAPVNECVRTWPRQCYFVTLDAC